MNAVIAERQLEFHRDGQIAAASVRILAPEPDGADWKCRYQLEWPGYKREFGITGIDSLQALVLALRVIPSVVGSTDDFKGGRIGAHGQRLVSFDDLDREIGLLPSDVKQ